MRTQADILGISVDDLTMEETIRVVNDCIENGDHIHHTVVNAGKIVAMQEDPELKESVLGADMINADGQSVVWASRFLRTPLKERVAGIDLMRRVLELAAKKGYKVYLLGGAEEVVNRVHEKVCKEFGNEVICGFRNGYFSREEEKPIAEEILSSGAQILFVGISSPKKENFLYRNNKLLHKVNFVMGVGGSFDVLAGKVKRAPLWMQKVGIEWLYRFLQEPKRLWKRYLIGNLKFIALVLQYKIKGERGKN